jgi:uncharacterized protein YggT (Ycf19 family)
MELTNLILDVAGLLMWFYWRTVAHARAASSAGVSLLSTLKRAEPPRSVHGSPLYALIALLLVRTFVYWHVGPAMEWTPHLPLGAIVLPFRSDFFDRILVFSLASFLTSLGTVYLWFLLLSAMGRTGLENDPYYRWIGLQLGWVDRWPRWVKLLLPLLGGGALWYAVNPLLVALEILPRPASPNHLLQQSLVMGLSTYLTWRYLILALLGLYVINSYVYLGNYPVWTSIHAAARNLLQPLAWLPLRIGSLDLIAPATMVLVFFLSRAGDLSLPWLFQRLPLGGR